MSSVPDFIQLTSNILEAIFFKKEQYISDCGSAVQRFFLDLGVLMSVSSFIPLDLGESHKAFGMKGFGPENKM